MTGWVGFHKMGLCPTLVGIGLSAYTGWLRRIGLGGKIQLSRTGLGKQVFAKTRGRRLVVVFFVLAYVAPLTVITSTYCTLLRLCTDPGQVVHTACTYCTLLRHVRRHARHSSLSVPESRAATAPSIAASTTPSIAAAAAAAGARRMSSAVSRRASHVTRVLVIPCDPR